MEELKKELRSLIAKDKVKQVLERMNQLPASMKGDMDDQITMVMAQFSSHTRNANMGILDASDARVEKAKIVAAILSLIDSLEEVGGSPAPAPVVEKTVNVTHTSPAVSPATKKRKILFMASNPTNTSQLRLGQEHREVENALREAQMRDKFELEERFAVMAKTLYNALLDENPEIVHFSGHGEMIKDSSASVASSEAGYRSLVFSLVDNAEDFTGYTGGIVIEDSEGKARLVEASVLANLFGNFPSIRCVFLNACYSEAQAEAILKKIPYVIGMNTAVPDKTAIVFATAFYRAIGNDRNYQEAFNLAKSYLLLEGLPGADIPVLRVNQELV